MSPVATPMTPFAVGRVNVYLIEDEPLTLVDTGPNSGTSLTALEAALAVHGRRVEDLERIVITHQHMDHFGLLAILADGRVLRDGAPAEYAPQPVVSDLMSLARRNPVPVVDVLRAAVSEVEQYQRIVVQTPPTATVLGRAASDIVHLLAELLDNAAQFSHPDTPVQVAARSSRVASILLLSR